MRAALYLRVSTDDQTTENQERELRAARLRCHDQGRGAPEARDRQPGRHVPLLSNAIEFHRTVTRWLHRVNEPSDEPAGLKT
jgi:hypothetical protein